jgi:NADPH:quinone reductase
MMGVTARPPGAAIGQKGETMRAVGLFIHGGPEVLQVVELPEVHAGPGQVRIRIHAATVNPTDIMARNGARAEQQKADPPPYVPGMEAAGIVDEVGSGVPDRLKLGDAVMAIVVPKGNHGAYREQIVLDARSVVRAPADRTHPEAATLPMNGLTVRLSLDLLKLSPGQVIAVTGAAGAYGGYVIQLAKAEGLTVIADASEKDEELVASLGADVVVRRGDDVASRIRGHFPQGVDGLADGAVLNARHPRGSRRRRFHVRPRLPGYPAAGYPLHDDLRALIRAGIREARSAPAIGRGQQNHASRGRALSAGKGGRRPSSAGGWRYERTAGHPILIPEDKPGDRSTRASSPFGGTDRNVVLATSTASGKSFTHSKLCLPISSVIGGGWQECWVCRRILSVSFTAKCFGFEGRRAPQNEAVPRNVNSLEPPACQVPRLEGAAEFVFLCRKCAMGA